jgi:AcrR family transcriptional regulator
MNQPRRRQVERREHTRAAVVDAAVARIARHGFARATLDQIAADAGLSKGAVSYHFRAKHALVGPVLARCTDALRARVRAAVAAQDAPGERLRGALRAAWTAQREGGVEVRALAELLALGAHDARAQRAVAAWLREVEREIALALDATLAALGLRTRAPADALPGLLVALLVGAALEARFAPEDMDREAATLAAVEALAMAAFAM